MPNKILIIFAHPLFEKSRIHQALVKVIPKSPQITFHDLYELYPDFNINVKKEKSVLHTHDVIIWQHPFYWYNVPPLLKQWIDMVLEYGWAYGPGGKALENKTIFNVLSCGGPPEAYTHEGRHKRTVREFLAPLEQTAVLCHMNYLPPFVIHGTHKLTPSEIESYAQQYHQLLMQFIEDDNLVKEGSRLKYLNDLV
jgi:glutathione-regulated potassium-efflux system ancillary protein KefG